MMVNEHNIVWTLDSYKQLHDVMYPEDTENVASYLEARYGEYPSTISFGGQYIIKKWLTGVVVTKELIDEAEPILIEHFKFNGKVWNRAKWDYIVEKHGGKLPVIIKTVPEGKIIPISNVLMTIQATDSKCFWLTNALETVLQQVWYPSTVATRSYTIVKFIKEQFKLTVDDDMQWAADYYLHDFGQRGVSCMEQAGIGGMAHLVNSKGTDTDMALPFALNYYKANLVGLGYSVPASEHSIATALGEEREFEVTKRLIKLFPNGILSVVSDSFGIEKAVNEYRFGLKDSILARDGKFVIRPDSPRFINDTPAAQVLWIAQQLEEGFGFTINKKGYKVINPKVGIIYGDGLSQQEIFDTIDLLIKNNFAASTCVFGQGGGLLQKLNRDTCGFAFKSCAQKRSRTWHAVYKKPSDVKKASKAGLLKLIKNGNNYQTVNEDFPGENQLVTVFKNGELTREFTFDEVRNNVNET